MAKAEVTVEELVAMIERGELRLPEMQRQYVWRSTRVRDLLDSLYRGYPSGAILLWETDEVVPLQEFAIMQQHNPYHSTRLLLDGQQRLTSLAAVIRGQPVTVRGRQRPSELLFNLKHPDELAVVTEVNENDDDDDLSEDEVDSTEDELQRRFDRMTFVVATRKLAQLPHWVKVSEIFVRVNSLGAKLRSSDLALAQITAKWRHSLKTFQVFQQQCAKRGFDLDLSLYL